MKPVILLDIDGVVGDFVGMICKHINRRFNTHYDESSFTSWELRAALAPAENEWIGAYLTNHNAAAEIEWYPGAKDFVHELQQLGEVLALTAPYQSNTMWPYERQQWCKREGLPVLSVPGEYKHLVQGDYLIEDKLMTVDQWGTYRPGAILLDRPWNQDPKIGSRQHYDRLFAYDGIVNHIRNEGREFTL